MRTLTLSLLTATLTALLVLALAHYGHAMTIPVHAQSDELNIVINSTLLPYWPTIATFSVPWSLEFHGSVDTEALAFHIDSLRGIAPTKRITFADGPYTFTRTIDPPGFDPLYTENVVQSFDLSIDWITDNFELAGPVNSPIDPIADEHGLLNGRIILAPFGFARINVAMSGTDPFELRTLDVLRQIDVAVRCTQTPIACAGSLEVGQNYVFTLGHEVLIHGVGSEPLLAQQTPEPSTMELIFLALIVVGIVKGTTKCV